MATKKELEDIIAAMYLDIERTVDKWEKQDDKDEWTLGFLSASRAAQDLIGIAIKSYGIPLPPKERNER